MIPLPSLSMLKLAAVVVPLAAALALAGYKTKQLADERAAHAQLRADVATERASAALRLVRISDTYRAAESTLQAQADEARKDAHAQDADRNAVHADLVRRLRIAQARAAAAAHVPGAAPTAAAGGGLAAGGERAEFPAPIGEADVDEAARAEKLRAAYNSCRRQYNDARGRLAALRAAP